MNNKFKEIDTVILCGGFGKRLKSVVGDRPKPMAEINSRPFLDILIEDIVSYGFKRFILCTGHMSQVIKKYFNSISMPIEILFREEKSPLGTGGAVKNAGPLIKSNTFLVINGDSICQVNFNDFLDFHKDRNAIISIVLARFKNPRGYGVVKLDISHRIIGFEEKRNTKGYSLVSAGIYLMQKDVFFHMPKRRSFSLEYDFFPTMVDSRCYGFLTKGQLIDIGTPERYKGAKEYF